MQINLNGIKHPHVFTIWTHEIDWLDFAAGHHYRSSVLQEDHALRNMKTIFFAATELFPAKPAAFLVGRRNVVAC